MQQLVAGTALILRASKTSSSHDTQVFGFRDAAVVRRQFRYF
jgi:hypothetical protein